MDVDVRKKYYYIVFNNVVHQGFGREVELPKHFATYANEKEWNAFAIRNLDNDPQLDIWMIDQSGEITNFSNDCDQ